MSARRRAQVLATVVALVIAACGTRVDRAAFEAELRTSATVVTQVSTPSSPVDADATPGSAPSGSAPVSAPSVTGPAGAASGTVAPAATTTSTTVVAVPDVSDAVVGDTIVIGMHVPITGAAPIPTDFMSSIDMIEEYTNGEAPIHGRGIDLVVEDDGYDAQVGLAACRRLADSDPLFVIGHSMPAAQDACADYFGERGIPYFMRGTYPEILDDRPLAWFGTLPDDLQGRLLAEYVLHQLGGVGRPSAIVYQNDQTAARDAFAATIDAGGGDLVASEQSVPRQPDYAATVEKLRAAGAEFVLLSMPPVDAIKISTQAMQADYHPIWLGGGTWWGYNMVLESASSALDGAIVTSPWPSIDSAAAEEFKAVSRRYRPDTEPEDVGMIMWGWMQLTRRAMEEAGPELSRRSLVTALQDLEFSPAYWHPIRYTQGDHRGASSAAVFQADGRARRWRQVTGFATGFAP